jgi:hypothetical protein
MRVNAVICQLSWLGQCIGAGARSLVTRFEVFWACAVPSDIDHVLDPLVRGRTALQLKIKKQ